MTKEGIEYNLSRLEYFLNSNARLLRKCKDMPDAEVLLEGYTRLLDYNGAGRDQLSKLYLTSDDYDEMDCHVSKFSGYRRAEDFHSHNPPTGPSIMRQGYITFEAFGYIFWVVKIDAYPEAIQDAQKKALVSFMAAGCPNTNEKPWLKWFNEEFLNGKTYN